MKQDALDLIELVQGILDEYDYPLILRQIYYQLVGRMIFADYFAIFFLTAFTAEEVFFATVFLTAVTFFTTFFATSFSTFPAFFTALFTAFSTFFFTVFLPSMCLLLK